MIDLHSHILPGLDDGARDMDEALEIAQTAHEDGIRVIAATPHVRQDFPTSAAEMELAVAEVRGALSAAAIPVELLTGGEIAFDRLDRLTDDEVRRFGLGGNRRYLLLETPYHGWPVGIVETVSRLRFAGITPVIAHPERSRPIEADPERLRPLIDRGALIQMTAASLDGRLGRRARTTARTLLDRRMAHLIASDAHSPGLRAVGLSSARRALGDDPLGRWLTEDVPAAMLAGDPLPPRPLGSRRTVFFARLRGR